MADTPPAPRLPKPRLLAGLQCQKQLWWRVHEPDAPELVPDVALRNRFAQGAEVDQRARGYVPGGELIDLPFYEYDNKVAATRDAIRHDRPVLYQPWFLADETYAGVDILTRGPRGYDVIEVKAANRLKPEHVPDVADRKSTRLNSSHDQISYAAFCLKKKKTRTGPKPIRCATMPALSALTFPAPCRSPGLSSSAAHTARISAAPTASRC